MSIVEHEFSFRPRARLVAILGEHLISDQAVAVVELVKNGYDADARTVTVSIGNPDDPDCTVTITDDGIGMTLEDVRERWLSPALDEKERAKAAGQRTPLGRLPIGEKGVGRFALHELGRSLELVTRAADGQELTVRIDWDEFEASEAFLGDIPVRVEERAPVVFVPPATGTQLTILRPRSQWNDKLLRKVHGALRRLQSPLQESASDFRLNFVCPSRPELESIESTDILTHAHYEFRALVAANGECDYEYRCRVAGLPEREAFGTERLTAFAGSELHHDPPSCGQFWLNLYVWDRTRDLLQLSGVSRAELDALCGVSIYRDGLRVLPYGEPGNDWLFLDQERIQAPAERIGNNQLIGLVEVDQSTNLSLRDKTNREGLIENDAFLDLRSLTRAAIRLFTSQWRKDRPPAKGPSPKREPTESVDGARQIAKAIRETAVPYVTVTVPSLDLTHGSADGSAGASAADPVALPQPKALDLLLGELDDVQRGIELRGERFERIVHLAGTGLAAERVVHEFGRQLVAASDALDHVDAANPQRRFEARETLRTVLSTLRNEFRVLAPYETVRRRARAQGFSVSSLATVALRLNDRILTDNRVSAGLTGDDFEILARGTEVLQILDNLVHNAAYWVGTTPEDTERKLLIRLDSGDQSVAVFDSGPGLNPDIADLAFEPFFSMKADGSGLGLYISGELARGAGAVLTLLPRLDPARPPWCVTGAAFELRFQTVHGDG